MSELNRIGPELIVKHVDWQRPEALRTLERSMKVSSMALLTGIKGVGKEILIRQFIQSNSLRAKSLYIGELFGLDEIIKTSSESKKECGQNSHQPIISDQHKKDRILDLLEEVKDYNLVIWHNSQNFSDLDRRILLTQLQRQLPGTFHILISDEVYLEDLPFTVTQLHLEPFQRKETLSYLRWLDGNEPKDWDIEKVMDQTKGLPVLIQIFHQMGEHGPFTMDLWFNQFSILDLEVLAYCCVAARPVSWGELYASFRTALGSTKRLQARWLLQKNEKGHWVVAPYIREMFLNKVSPSKMTHYHSLLLSNRDRWLGWSEIRILWHAIFSEDFGLIKSYLAKIVIDDLESIPARELSRMVKKMDELFLLGEDKETNAFESHIGVLRFYLRLHFLVGTRWLAIQFVKPKVNQLLVGDHQPEDGHYLILEYIECLNRVQKCEEAARISQLALTKVSALLRPLVLIQYACAISGRNEPGAVESLKGSIKASLDLQKSVLVQPGVTNLDRRSHSKSLALAHFELARIIEWQGDLSAATDLYETALIYFEENGQFYHGLVVHLNLAWIYLKTHSWKRLNAKVKEVLKQAEVIEARYIRAGIELIDSIQDRLFLRFDDSLSKLKAAQKWLPREAPLEARFDVAVEEFNTQMMIGQYDVARLCLSEIERLISNETNRRLSVRLENLKLRYQIIVSDEDKGLTEFGSFKNGMGGLDMICPEPVLYVNKDIDFKGQIELNDFPLGRLVLMESDLIEALGKGRDRTAIVIQKFRSLLNTFSKPTPQAIALDLLEYHFNGKVDENLIAQAGELLAEWELAYGNEWGIRAWLEAIKQKTTPQESSAWTQLSYVERSRWKAWFHPFFSQTGNMYDYLTETGIVSRKERRDFVGEFLMVDDTTAEVFFTVDPLAIEGNRINQLFRSHRIRKTLVTLLEVYPKPISKCHFSQMVWGEEYSPLVHDNRIYISIQRLRDYLQIKNCILVSDEGYLWNSSYPFLLVRSAKRLSPFEHQVVSAVTQQIENGNIWVSRGQLLKSLNCSESTLKRELSRLLSLGRVIRKGAGRGTVYALKT